MIRLSGPDALAIAQRVWHSTAPLVNVPPRTLVLGTAKTQSGECLDAECLAVRFLEKASYTGETVVELQCHGGALCIRRILDELLAAGARHAEPGEFTLRAFLNGRLDLTQAEAVADVITATSSRALHVAGNQLNGRLGKAIEHAYDSLADTLAEIESRMDFPEEELDWKPTEILLKTVLDAQTALKALYETRHAGKVLRNSLSLAIVGKPNVGKSSLLNYILGRERAIVTDIPGTTRDTIEEMVTIRDIPVTIVDTAGIRANADVIERTGMERAQTFAQGADIVIWLTDATLPYENQKLPEDWTLRGALFIAANKSDAITEPPNDFPDGTFLISAKTGAGIDALYDAIQNASGIMDAGTGDIAVAARHAELLADALASLESIDTLIQNEIWECAAVSLRNAISALGRIVGRAVEPDVLETIFHRFCIGK